MPWILLRCCCRCRHHSQGEAAPNFFYPPVVHIIVVVNQVPSARIEKNPVSECVVERVRSVAQAYQSNRQGVWVIK